jgi:hypothetical protein
MKSKQQAELEAMRLELALNKETWVRAKKQLAARSDRVLAVPRESLERIDAACAPRVERFGHPVLRV